MLYFRLTLRHITPAIILPVYCYLCKQAMTIRATRRKFLRTTGLTASVFLFPGLSVATAREERRLGFMHMHTGETLSVVYHDGEQYVSDALAEIDHLLRDFRAGESHAIDPGLLDILHGVQTLTQRNATFEVISGYRSPATNEMLANKSRGVAKRSLHMQGRAIDIRMTGVNTRQVREAAMQLARGGFGFYDRSDFIHLDTGNFRHG
jgi:uncharacterized protein YcbK (DUF882 family)